MTNPGEKPGWDIGASIDDAFNDSPLARAVQWIANVENAGNPRDRFKKMKRFILNSDARLVSCGSGIEAMHIVMRNRAIELCRVWDIDPVQNANPHAAHFAFLAARSLAIDSGIMTVEYDNFHTELETLKGKGRPYAEKFSEKAFQAMAMLDPDTYMMLNRLNESMTEGLYRSESDIPYQRAGIGLAYGLAARTTEPDLTQDLLS